jgi:hypothetical protein
MRRIFVFVLLLVATVIAAPRTALGMADVIVCPPPDAGGCAAAKDAGPRDGGANTVVDVPRVFDMEIEVAGLSPADQTVIGKIQAALARANIAELNEIDQKMRFLNNWKISHERHRLFWTHALLVARRRLEMRASCDQIWTWFTAYVDSFTSVNQECREKVEKAFSGPPNVINPTEDARCRALKICEHYDYERAKAFVDAMMYLDQKYGSLYIYCKE